MRMLRPIDYPDIKSKQNSLPNFATQKIENIGLEEPTISYFPFMSQLDIPLQNHNNSITS
jgi:hypothetical protein